MKARAADVLYDALHDLRHRASQDEAAADFAAYAWLQERCAGNPNIVLFEGMIAENAKQWSEIATPPELEAYFLASGAKLADRANMMHGRVMKRIIAALWVAMSPDEQSAFLKWAEGKRNA